VHTETFRSTETCYQHSTATFLLILSAESLFYITQQGGGNVAAFDLIKLTASLFVERDATKTK